MPVFSGIVIGVHIYEDTVKHMGKSHGVSPSRGAKDGQVRGASEEDETRERGRAKMEQAVRFVEIKPRAPLCFSSHQKRSSSEFRVPFCFFQLVELVNTAMAWVSLFSRGGSVEHCLNLGEPRVVEVGGSGIWYFGVAASAPEPHE